MWVWHDSSYSGAVSVPDVGVSLRTGATSIIEYFPLFFTLSNCLMNVIPVDSLTRSLIAKPNRKPQVEICPLSTQSDSYRMLPEGKTFQISADLRSIRRSQYTSSIQSQEHLSRFCRPHTAPRLGKDMDTVIGYRTEQPLFLSGP